MLPGDPRPARLTIACVAYRRRGGALCHLFRLIVHDRPLPLVVEVWAPLTSDYDLEAKLADYQARGDLEIWRIHPYERTLTTWRRENGSYTKEIIRDDFVQPVALPNVTIDLAALFDV